MKILLFGIAELLILTLLTACTYSPTEHQELTVNTDIEARPLISDRQELSMYVRADSVTPTGLRLSMINDSELYFGHGAMFSIEQYLEGEWMQVPFIDDVIWIMPLFIISPKTTVDENLSWEHMHGRLQPGQYRVVRDFTQEDWDDPTPPWERDIPVVSIYTTFKVEQDWQAAYDRWQSEQDDLAAIAYARFDGLDLEISKYSPYGLSFTLTNNNPYYTYIIDIVFVGWEDSLPGLVEARSVEYFIFTGLSDGGSWPFGDEKRLQPGEYFSLEVDWQSQIGSLTPGMPRLSPNPYIFGLYVGLTLDASEEYIRENFSRIIPGHPNTSHRIYASFDISP